MDAAVGASAPCGLVGYHCGCVIGNSHHGLHWVIALRLVKLLWYNQLICHMDCFTNYHIQTLDFVKKIVAKPSLLSSLGPLDIIPELMRLKDDLPTDWRMFGKVLETVFDERVNAGRVCVCLAYGFRAYNESLDENILFVLVHHLCRVNWDVLIGINVNDLIRKCENNEYFVIEAPLQPKAPEDNTPLQAQQEDNLQEKTFESAATSETSISAITQPSGRSTTNWERETHAGAEQRIWITSTTWATNQTTGTLLNLNIMRYTGGNTSGPLFLPQAINWFPDPDAPAGANADVIGVTQFTQMYQTHGLYRSGYRVFLTINGTQFHSGSLFAVAVPAPHCLVKPQSNQQADAGIKVNVADLFNVAQCGIYPSGRLLPRSNSELVLDLPYVHHSPMKQTTTGEVDYAIFVFVETKLGIPTTGTAPTLTLNVEVAPVGAVFAASKRPQRTLQQIVDITAYPTVPVPACEMHQERVVPGVGAIASARSGTLQRVNFSGRPSTSFLPPRIENFQSLLSRPTIKAVLSVGANYNPGQILAEWDVGPINNLRSNNTGNVVKTIEGSSFLETFSRYFLQWQGSIVYTLEWTGPAVSSGRLILGFQPGAAREAKYGNFGPELPSGSVLRAISQGPHVVWDMANSTSVSFKADFALDTPWGAVKPLQTTFNTGSAGATTTDAGGVGTKSISGTMFLAMLSPIVTPTTTQTTFELVLHESAGPDFNLRYFAPRASNTFPIYNGVLDQGPVEIPDVPGSRPIDEHYLSVEKVLNHPRLIASGSFTRNKVLVLPLTLISYSSSSNTAKIVPARIFPSLFTYLQADLRIIVTTSSTANTLVAYRPPGITDTGYGEVPVSAADLTNANWTIFSTRSDNTGFELFVPFPSIQGSFATSLATLIRSDVVYKPQQDQYDPGSLGSILVVNRDVGAANVNQQDVSVFLALENVSAHVPRCFGPLTSQIVQPTFIAQEVDQFVQEPQEVEFEVEMPRHISKQEFVDIWDLTEQEMQDGITNDGWEIASLVGEMRCNTETSLEFSEDILSAGDRWWNEMCQTISEIEEQINMEGFEELPLEYPLGPELDGNWVNGEWYRLHPSLNPQSSHFWETPYIRYMLVHDPSPRMQQLHYCWVDTRIARTMAMDNTFRAWLYIRRSYARSRSLNIPYHLYREYHRAMDFIRHMEIERFGNHEDSSSDSEDSGFFSDDQVDGMEVEAPITPKKSSEGKCINVQNPVTQSEGEEVSSEDDEPPPKWLEPVIYKVNRGLYTHWGIGYKNTCISLRQFGMTARVSITTDLDLKKAVTFKPTNMKVWFQTVSALGQTFPDYNAHENCTTFVEAMSGEKLQNTGDYLVMGVAAVAATIPFIFQSPSVPVKTTKRGPPPRYQPRRCMFFNRKGRENFEYEMPIGLNITNQALEQSTQNMEKELRNTLQVYNDMAPNLSAAVTNAAASFQGASMKATEFLTKLEDLVGSATEFLPSAAQSVHDVSQSLISSLGKKVGSIILKTIGYILIIFGNPNPATVAGVIALLASEVMDSKFLRDKIRSACTTLSHKIQAVFLRTFGLNSCDDDPEIFSEPTINQAYAEYMNQRAEFEAEAPSQTLVNFNQGVLAMKNVDWILEKIKELISFVIDKLKGKEKKDPEAWLKSRSEYMVKLYDDSVTVATCQNVDRKLLDKRMKETNEMLAFAVNNKLTNAVSLLTRTLTNYKTVARKLDASAYQERQEPLVVYIHGGPGCGKSILSNIIARAYCRKHGLDYSSSVYTTPPGSEFFDGYNGQAVHIIDDFCQNTTGEDVKLFCQMVSTVNFIPPMASLEEKGVSYSSKLIIATSNLSTPSSNEIRIPGALERRCYFKVKTMLHPGFTTPTGKLDMNAAFKPLGKSKLPYFKQDCPYLNGAALSCSVIAGEERRSEKMDVYDLIELVFAELERRSGCQDMFQQIFYENPRPEDVKCFEDGVIPTLCNHVDHDEGNCFRVYFRKGDHTWYRDFLNETERRKFMQGYHLGKLPEGKELRPCGCGDPRCGKILFLNGDKGKTFDFRSKSAMNYFLFTEGKSFELFDPEPFVPTGTNEEKKDLMEVRKELLGLKKSCFLSFCITALGAVASVIAAIIYICKRRKNQSQGPYAGLPGKKQHGPPQQPVLERDIRYEAPRVLPQIYEKIQKNVMSINFECPGYYDFQISGLGLFERTVATCYHAVKNATYITINGKRYAKNQLNPVRVKRSGNPTDLCFLTLPDGNQFKDITRFFLAYKDRFPRDDCVLISRAEKLSCNMLATNIRGLKSVSVKGLDEDQHYNVIAYDVPSMPGLCGSPLLSKNGAREVVLGIHFAGTGAAGLAVPIYKEDFGYFMQGDIKEIEHPGRPTHVPRKSNLKHSPAFGAFEPTHEPAALSKHDPRIKGVDLDKVMFSKHTTDHPGWPTLEPAMAYVVDDLMFKLGFSKDDKIEMWSLEEAINGRGVMDGIDMAQSPGYPYNTQGKSRRSFFEWENNMWVPTQELRDEVKRALAKPEDFYFTTFLKDELRPSAKVRAGKTRLVDGDSLPRVLAYRMVFGALFERMISKNGCGIHSAVGCNPETDWTRFFLEIGPSKYPYCFDLDYSCFDSTEPAVSFRLMARYFQPYFACDVRPFFEALAVSKHVYEGVAMEIVGGMPSGCVGTSMFNCVNNSAYIVSALIGLGINPSDVDWLCYGDDVIIGTHEKALSKRIAEYYHKHTPLIVTPASKSGDFPETSTIYEVTFLKRYFQPDSSYPCLIHPYMPLDHLQQSVMWKTDGPFQAKLDSLMMLAFHAGGLAYREFVRKVDMQCRKNGEAYNFRPFEFYMAQWYANFF
nr:MAG: polymerase [Yellow-eyed penguin megrivirus]